MIDFEKHPCFNDKARHKFGRVHLPVAPRCNVQCNFCNRDFECVNESRPGVSSTILKPEQVKDYLEKVMQIKENIAVVGIAGPGDPMANPEETLATFEIVRENYPDMMLCLSTNGLNLSPYVEKLAELNISHVTVTVNAVDPAIAAQIYSWARYGRRTRNNIEAGQIIVEEQEKAIKLLKKYNIVTKINTILLPGINDHHIPEIVDKMKEFDVEIMNCIPMIPVKGTKFEELQAPPAGMIKDARLAIQKEIPLMHHCTRCRADAVGLIGDSNSSVQEILETFAKNKPEPAYVIKKAEEPRSMELYPYFAVGSHEGMLINKHLGEVDEFLIYQVIDGAPVFKEKREAPDKGAGMDRWADMAKILHDCSTILVSGVGGKPHEYFKEVGINLILTEGLIDYVLTEVIEGNMDKIAKRKMGCGTGCGGDGGGCD